MDTDRLLAELEQKMLEKNNGLQGPLHYFLYTIIGRVWGRMISTEVYYKFFQSIIRTIILQEVIIIGNIRLQILEGN